MNRRNFLSMLASLPLLGWLKPKGCRKLRSGNYHNCGKIGQFTDRSEPWQIIVNTKTGEIVESDGGKGPYTEPLELFIKG